MKQSTTWLTWVVLEAVMAAGLIFGSVPARAEEKGFGFRGVVLSIAFDKSRIQVNETWLRITGETEVLNLENNRVNVDTLKVGDRVHVVAEHENGYDEALQISQMQNEKTSNEKDR